MTSMRTRIRVRVGIQSWVNCFGQTTTVGVLLCMDRRVRRHARGYSPKAFASSFISVKTACLSRRDQKALMCSGGGPSGEGMPARSWAPPDHWSGGQRGRPPLVRTLGAQSPSRVTT